MGMFDYVICEQPLPDGQPAETFQTKSMPVPYLDRYAIRADGTLWRLPYDEDAADDGDDSARWQQLDQYLGEIVFRGADSKRAFSAYFLDGRLVHLVAIVDSADPDVQLSALEQRHAQLRAAVDAAAADIDALRQRIAFERFGVAVGSVVVSQSVEHLVVEVNAGVRGKPWVVGCLPRKGGGFSKVRRHLCADWELAPADRQCSWTGGDAPCPQCPRVVSALHRCKLLQDCGAHSIDVRGAAVSATGGESIPDGEQR